MSDLREIFPAPGLFGNLLSVETGEFPCEILNGDEADN